MTDTNLYNEELELDCNDSNNMHFDDILQRRINRRDLISKTASGAVALTVASNLTACGGSSDTSSPSTNVNARPNSLTFSTVAKNLNDIVTVPEGYQVNVLYALGDPINQTVNAWDDNNIPTGPSFQFRSGDCHDGMHFFGMNASTLRYSENESNQGLLVMNHEYINPFFLHPNGPTRDSNNRRPEDQVIREVNAHGVSIIQIQKNNSTQAVSINKNSIFNRRITASTVMDFAGSAAGSALLSTKFSPAGRSTRGTHNNCGNGTTPWGTYLTCEENFIGYFFRAGADQYNRTANEQIALKRYGLGLAADDAFQYKKDAKGAPELDKDGKKIYLLDANNEKIPNVDAQGRQIYLDKASRYGWESAIGQVDAQDMYDRWTASAVATNAAADYRNGPNTFGWIVEIDPFDGRQNPVKRTALGRFAHEDCRHSRVIEGQNLAFYMGDDSQNEYIYKFVSDAKWDAKDVNGGYAAGDKYMNSGKLFVAKFNANGTGEWLELTFGKNGLDLNNTTYPFSSQADVLTYTRLAADSVGATKMDRPEWCAVNPSNGEVYVTLTNNTIRTAAGVDAANPRSYSDIKTGKSTPTVGNVNGHIIRFRETGNTTTATTFNWDIYLFGAEAAMASNINLSGLSDANDLSSPDGMWFDPRGVLWIQTDDGNYTDVTNCMMLAALPGQVGDGSTVTTVSNQATVMGAKVTDSTLRRFLTGPKESEITGISMTPDLKALFVNIQHPGEESTVITAPNSNWPTSQTNSSNKTARPRSATVVITRKDGGVIAG